MENLKIMFLGLLLYSICWVRARLTAGATVPVAILTTMGCLLELYSSHGSPAEELDGKKATLSSGFFTKLIYRSISDHREIKRFQKLRGEVSFFELLVFQKGDMKRNRCFDAIDDKLLQGSLHSHNHFLP